MKHVRFFALVATLSLGSVAVGVAAPKPAAPPSQFVPEVIYPYKSSTSEDVRLSNASGTAAVLLHRGRAILAYDLAPPSLRLATYIDTDVNNMRHLRVRSWTTTASGGIAVGPERTLVSSVNMVQADFSPTGDRIAFRTGDHITGYDLNVVDVATGVVTKISTARSIVHLRWSQDGNSFYYQAFNNYDGVVRDMTAFRQPLGGGEPVLIFQRPVINSSDISRDGTDGLILRVSVPGSSNYALGKWDGSTITTLPFLNANFPHYSCGNDRLIYRSATNGSPGPVKIHTFATNSDITFSRDKLIIQADFMPCEVR
jgi:hypothetical protein